MVNTGQILLSVCLALAAIQFVTGVFKLNISQQKLSRFLFLTIAVSFFYLVYSYVTSNFFYQNVFENSHSMKPTFYKVTGVWGNHEGSMLLFLFVLSLYSFLYSFLSDYSRKDEVLFFQGVVSLLLLIYIYFFSSPFDVNEYILKGMEVREGLGLNPLLQDVGLAIHPPVLYLGYAGFSLCFSGALVVLRDNLNIKEFMEDIRFYNLLSWAFLGLGIALGSWWAYRELGWGGFWFWDPVENSSLVPWLLASAMLHTSIYSRKFGGYVFLTLMMCLCTFLMSLIGFFLVRSGILSSVHSFASDPDRGIVMLIIVSILLLYSAYLLGRNIFRMSDEVVYKYELVSRQVHLGLNAVIFISMALTILLGLFYPIILEVMDINSISVGEPYFEKTFLPMVALLALVAIFTPYIKWHKNPLGRLFRALPSMVSSVVITFLIVNYTGVSGLMAIICLFSGLWLFLSMLELYVIRIFSKDEKITRGLNVLFLSHGGFGLLVVFITLLVSLEHSIESTISINKPFEDSGYKISLVDSKISKVDNYLKQEAFIDVELKNGEVLHLSPENRVYFPDVKKTYETDIKTDFVADYYLVMGSSKANEKGDYEFPVRFYFKPMALYMWLAMFMISLGGFVALIPKRK